jgi:hypothetical protein
MHTPRPGITRHESTACNIHGHLRIGLSVSFSPATCSGCGGRAAVILRANSVQRQ